MDEHSHFSVYLDGELPDRFRKTFERIWGKDPRFLEFQRLQQDVSRFLQSGPEPDFESRKEAVFERIQTAIQERRVVAKPRTLLSRRVRVAWAAAAVFVALIGGIVTGRVLLGPSGAPHEEVITFQLPEGFDLNTPGNPEYIQLSTFRRRP